jgi:hypothetical protein
MLQAISGYDFTMGGASLADREQRAVAALVPPRATIAWMDSWSSIGLVR